MTLNDGYRQSILFHKSDHQFHCNQRLERKVGIGLELVILNLLTVHMIQINVIYWETTDPVKSMVSIFSEINSLFKSAPLQPEIGANRRYGFRSKVLVILNGLTLQIKVIF